MRPDIDGKTVDTIEAMELTVGPRGSFKYAPCEWPNAAYLDPRQIRIRFTDGSSVTFAPQGYETDGVDVDYKEAE